ncbi:type II toxin-antitoxin system VapC family toxin [Methanobrevibacter curvatus]|uniref:PIN domain protein n=1 Tax=Methanobrevibacter curvatus TaxID=49547 RepID=A0A162FG24_9EURY|nr:type II toxin-antitoxin system VapC family toxin [Methanobrevibacter curvatus]KZX12535.1 PIN domain protein [Methanobrevibacter curvatus]
MIFIDSSFFLAYFDENHKKHKDSLKVAAIIRIEKKVINNFTIAITVSKIRNLIDEEAAEIVYNHLINNYEVIYDNRKRTFEAIKLLRENKYISNFSDGLSLAIINEKNIKEIASFNSNFDGLDGLERIYY